ncbi:Uu.00g120260.m01.CDS01 [Anthostomella pinea]|uniref:Uu.00g120260.m01.CDS01 n=1 Tax=Anthostomella pinea TaxID=933095 RepID=A0AAI8VGT6_9PEZI|nr:Uu.00g120260.m01.CDS01 [Anthostomella pinea]
MAPTTVNNPLETLDSLVQSTTSLVAQLETLLHSVASSTTYATITSPSTDSQAPDVLSLAHDSASLIKAHTTKLSLLIINEPFTPSAIVKVLRELVGGPIPGIATAVQICEPHNYTTVARQDLAWRCYRVLKELKGLVAAIPFDGKALPDARKNGSSGGKGSIAATGVIWAACDDVMLLKKLGIAGLLVKKVEDYRDTLKDVLEELKEWSEEVEDEDEDDDEAADDEDEVHHVTGQMQNTHISTQEMLDDLMNSQRIPRDDPDKIRERLDSCLKRLRLTTLLYSAIVKRRLKIMPPLPTQTPSPVAQRLDEVFPILKRLPHRFGEVAGAFYDLDPNAIDRAMDSCFFDVFAASEMLSKPWIGETDEFTEWVAKFKVSIKKPD